VGGDDVVGCRSRFLWPLSDAPSRALADAMSGVTYRRHAAHGPPERPHLAPELGKRGFLFCHVWSTANAYPNAYPAHTETLGRRMLGVAQLLRARWWANRCRRCRQSIRRQCLGISAGTHC